MISFFIPIRKGSKRVKNKNIRPIKKFRLGLTEIKILQLRKLCNSINRLNLKKFKPIEIIVSTNCEKVKKFLKPLKWIKIHHRNEHLSSDDCLGELIKEVPRICQGEYIVWTHVTSPCFNEKDYLDFLIKFFKKSNNTDSAFSADLVGTYILNEDNKWISHNYRKKNGPEHKI